MATNPIEKSLKETNKILAKVEKSETNIDKTLEAQLKLDKKLTGMIDDQNKLNKSILRQLESVQKQTLQEQVMRQQGYCEALHDVWQLLHDRRYELWECLRLKGGLSNVEKA